MDFKGRARMIQSVLQIPFSSDLVTVFGYQLKLVSIKCTVAFTIMHACFSLSVFLFVGVCWCLHELVCVDVCEVSGANGYLGVRVFSVCAFFLN